MEILNMLAVVCGLTALVILIAQCARVPGKVFQIASDVREILEHMKKDG